MTLVAIENRMDEDLVFEGLCYAPHALSSATIILMGSAKRKSEACPDFAEVG